MAASTPSTIFTEMIASRYSVDQSSSVAGVTRASAARAPLRRRAPRTGVEQHLHQRRRAFGWVRGAVDQQRFGRAADAGAPHLGVDVSESFAMSRSASRST
jgi:hypothetical protein